MFEQQMIKHYFAKFGAFSFSKVNAKFFCGVDF